MVDLCIMIKDPVVIERSGGVSYLHRYMESPCSNVNFTFINYLKTIEQRYRLDTFTV